ncbi:MAG: hypothetical protein RLZZ65_1228 [Bacteroidota bacterium]
MSRYQRNSIFFLLFSLSAALSMRAQDSVTYWKFKSLYSLSGTQTSFVNWNAGGRNNISLIGSASASAYYTQDNIKWTNDLSFALGGIKYFDNKGIGAQKTDDRLDVSSTFGMQLSKGFFLTFASSFRTQSINGFAYPNDSVPVSSFMAPGFLNIGLGADFRKDDNFNIFFSSIALKSTFVLDDSLSAKGSFGVEPGMRYRQEYGAYLKMKYNKVLAKNIEMKSKLELFSNYLHNPENIDVNTELVLLFRVNSLVSASAQWNLIYDDDIRITDALGNIGPRTQFKSVIGIGLSYKIER